jgi:hypothetical protein
MTRNLNTVDHPTLLRMHAAGVITDAELVAEPGGWAVVVQVKRTQYPLVSKRGQVRRWARFESAAAYLAGFGLTEFRVNAKNIDALQAGRTRRPDAAAKLRAAHKR